MTRHALDLGFGATLLGPERTRFRLWAPGQAAVSLVVEGQQPVPMRPGEDGWFDIEAACGAGTLYRYRLADGLEVPDPASRFQPRDVHGPSEVIDPRAYAWRNTTWRGRPWEETVIYELHAGLLGGFAGVAEKLPALAELGITAVQLMPVSDFPGDRNWGYDGVLPYAPDSAYGRPEDLKALVDRAHDLGLQIFLDVVYNHFGPDGNYIPVLAPEFFRDDLHTPWGGAIDFRRPQVRDYFTRNVLYWLNEYRFDGLRFDAVHAIPEADWLDEMAGIARRSVEPGRHVHFILENEHNDAPILTRDIDAQWNDDVHHCLHVMLTDDHHGYYGNYVRDTAGKLARAMREGFVYQGEAPETGVGNPRGTPSASLPPTAFIDCLQNHDQVGNRAIGERLTVLADHGALRAAIGLLLICPHIPMIFMGEETGATEPFLFFTSHGEELAGLVREGRRKEFAAFPEFADPERRERIPDPNALATFEASRPRLAGDPEPEGHDQRDAWVDFYGRLLAFRHREIVPRLAGARAEEAVPLGRKGVLARWRMGDGARLTLAMNLAGGAETAPDGWIKAGAPAFLIGAAPDGADAVPPRTTWAWIERDE